MKIDQQLYIAQLAVNGVLQAATVVEDARREASPIHDLFDWDRDKAAEEHWLAVARGLIRQVRVEVTTTEYHYRVAGYIKDPTKPNDEAGYVATSTVAQDAVMTAAAIEAEVARVRSNIERARQICRQLGDSAAGHLEERIRELVAGAPEANESAA